MWIIPAASLRLSRTARTVLDRLSGFGSGWLCWRPLDCSVSSPMLMDVADEAGLLGRVLSDEEADSCVEVKPAICQPECPQRIAA